MEISKTEFIVTITLFFIAGLVLGFVFSEEINHLAFNTFFGNNMGEITNSSNCSNLSIEKTAKCLVAYVDTFYNYNENNTGVDLTFEELKEQGGVCWYYARLYEKLALDLGFFATTTRIENETNAHRFAIIWSKDVKEYCVIDQLVYWCRRLG